MLNACVSLTAWLVLCAATMVLRMGITATCRACGGTGWQYIELKPGAKASAQQWLGEQPAAYQATIKKLVSQVKLSKAEKLPKVESVLPETGPSIP